MSGVGQAVVRPEHDRIQEIQDAPNWSENLLVQWADRATGHSMWAHWGRVPANPQIWEAVIALLLPDGELLISRSFGRGAAPDEASSGCQSFRCVEPLKHWTASFEGMARRVQTEDIAESPLMDGLVEYLRIDLDFVGVHPPWSPLDHMADQDWATNHLEQGGTIRVQVEYAGKTLDIETQGLRDHSYGPRDYQKVIGDCWVAAVFPSGRTLMALQIWADDDNEKPLTTGFVWDGDSMHAIPQLDLPVLTGSDASPRTFGFDLDIGPGRSRVDVEQTHQMSWTFENPTLITAGARQDSAVLLATEGPAIIRWDGEETDGWIEKSRRNGLIGK